VPVYAQIMDQIRKRVLDGKLTRGTPLPSVRVLADSLDLNPNTVAKAYALLEREGTVRTVSRRGTFVEAAVDNPPIDRRAEEAADRVLAEAEARGIEKRQILDALRRRLEGAGSRPRRRRR
jgi:DNA-binding transcriptional regulator YhcF (GntR family)